MSHETFCNTVSFYGDEFLAPHPTPMLEDHLCSAVCDYLLNIMASTLRMYLEAVPPSAA
jgi:hypothetical protein